MYVHTYVHAPTPHVSHTLLLTSPSIRLSVQVPLIEAQPGEIDLGDCYLYYPYLSCVELINHSDLFARYSLQEQVQH